MDIQLPDDFANRIQKYIDAKHGATVLDILRRAMDSYEVIADPVPLALSAENLHMRFSRFRGMLKGLTHEQMLQDRHQGLS